MSVLFSIWSVQNSPLQAVGNEYYRAKTSLSCIWERQSINHKILSCKDLRYCRRNTYNSLGLKRLGNLVSCRWNKENNCEIFGWHICEQSNFYGISFYWLSLSPCPGISKDRNSQLISAMVFNVICSSIQRKEEFNKRQIVDYMIS